MSAVEIAKNIYWVGAIDWDVRHFHGHTYTTQRGTTYNSYLIIDDKITLIDTVHAGFTDDMVEKIKQVIDPAKIDYVVMNHVEPDHSGSFPLSTSCISGGPCAPLRPGKQHDACAPCRAECTHSLS